MDAGGPKREFLRLLVGYAAMPILEFSVGQKITVFCLRILMVRKKTTFCLTLIKNYCI